MLGTSALAGWELVALLVFDLVKEKTISVNAISFNGCFGWAGDSRLVAWGARRACAAGTTYGNLEIHHLLSERRHIVIKAECVFASGQGREDKVALSFLGAILDNLAAGRGHGEIDIEGAARLDLSRYSQSA